MYGSTIPSLSVLLENSTQLLHCTADAFPTETDFFSIWSGFCKFAVPPNYVHLKCWIVLTHLIHHFESYPSVNIRIAHPILSAAKYLTKRNESRKVRANSSTLKAEKWRLTAKDEYLHDSGTDWIQIAQSQLRAEHLPSDSSRD